MCIEYDNMQYCPALGGYCYTPNECNCCSVYDEYFEREENKNEKEVKAKKTLEKMDADLLYDLKDLKAEIGALLLASNIRTYNMHYDDMKNKIDEIIKNVEGNLYEKK